ncbi:hypothetical protein QNO07_26600 [Streptomyces sp. 549]|uniref:DUF7544 domain-containing protein n=1 Tax=Streptomyces sp. 549 TaxID=3049076 RepID=UPI0024C35ABC|nr:hypothetical protein [Streptomyces sp. 549]MDK1476928.1 hypothetical protein [Streptomyces sp. 549]
MNESPGWASPGSSPSEPSGDQDRERTPPGDAVPPHPGSAVPPPAQPTGWSAQQPPSAGPTGWGAPPPPPGGPGGWQQNWQQAPAAKPGVIPLRPLGMTEILDGAVSTMRAHWRPVLGISIGVAVLIQLVSTVVTGLWFRNLTSLEALENNPEPTLSEVMDAFNGTLASQSIPMLTTMVGTVIATAMLTIVVSRAVLGRPVSIGEAWQDSRPLLLRLLGLSLLVMLIVIGAMAVGFVPGILVAASSPAAGLLLFFFGGLGGVVLAIWLWVRYCLAAPALMLERQGPVTALRRSAKLVRGSWWRIFGIQMLALLLVMVLSFIVSIPTVLIAALMDGDGAASLLTGGPTDRSWTYLIVMGVGSVVTSALTLPFSAGVSALLYMDRRIRREALDIDLARAAGVADGTTGTPDRPDPGQ